MTIGPGTRVGPYRITGLLADGGMGQVWRAHHTLLNRDDALTILPASLAADPRRLERFAREAQVLAALNHPNIARVYGLEHADVAPVLAMELVEGPTLADRLATGPLPLGDALTIARQLADALEAAHAYGIVHGHLTPSVIKVTGDGAVKVLGFGHGRSGDGELSAGKAVDRRTDLWGFGAVLMAMLTGRPPSASPVKPDWRTLPDHTPASIRRLLRRCLEPDPRQRLADISSARLELEDAIPAPGSAEVPVVGDPAPVRVAPVALAVVATALGTGLAAWWLLAPPPAPPPQMVRFTILPPASLPLTTLSLFRDIAIAPDGSFLVYASATQGQLVVRPIDQLDATPLAGVKGASAPFVSPDGRWIGYFEDYTTLRKVARSGGPPITVARMPGTPRGAAWVDETTIIAATSSPTTGLLRIAATGSERAPTELTRPDPERGELGHWHPSPLPGGRAVLFTVAGVQPADARIAVLDLETGEQTTLMRGGRDAQYVAPGHLVYTATGGTLFAVAFDPARRAVGSDPVAVLTGVSVSPSGAANATVAETGTLIYVPSGEGGVPARSLVWVDRQGRETPLATPPRAYVSPRLSPDGTRVAVEVRDQEQDIWLWRLADQSLVRLTTDPAGEAAPVWTPDGRHLIFASTRTGALNLFLRPADGSGADVRLSASANAQAPTSATPDGASLIAHEVRSTTARDLIRIDLDDMTAGRQPATVHTIIGTPFDELNGAVSPDGRFIAYQSSESGRIEIYVRPYPQVTSGRWLVSTDGGTQPAWTRGGGELIYLDAGGRLTAVDVDTSGSGLRAGIPRRIVDRAYATPAAYRTYDVTPDGERLLVVKEGTGDAMTSPAGRLVVVEHWSEELTARIRQR